MEGIFQEQHAYNIVKQFSIVWCALRVEKKWTQAGEYCAIFKFHGNESISQNYSFNRISGRKYQKINEIYLHLTQRKISCTWSIQFNQF